MEMYKWNIIVVLYFICAFPDVQSAYICPLFIHLIHICKTSTNANKSLMNVSNALDMPVNVFIAVYYHLWGTSRISKIANESLILSYKGHKTDY